MRLHLQSNWVEIKIEMGYFGACIAYTPCWVVYRKGNRSTHQQFALRLRQCYNDSHNWIPQGWITLLLMMLVGWWLVPKQSPATHIHIFLIDQFKVEIFMYRSNLIKITHSQWMNAFLSDYVKVCKIGKLFYFAYFLSHLILLSGIIASIQKFISNS